MKIKKFDCVNMKNEIQRKLASATDGLTLAERNESYERKIQSDPALASLWRNAERVSNSGLQPKHE